MTKLSLLRKLLIFTFIVTLFNIKAFAVKDCWINNGGYIYITSTEKLNYDCSDGKAHSFAYQNVYFEIIIDSYNNKYYRMGLIFYSPKREVRIPKGTKMMIRTNSGNVYECFTPFECKNSVQVENHYAGTNYTFTGACLEYTQLNVEYELTEEVFKDIAKNGIAKLRWYGAIYNYETGVNFNPNSYQECTFLIKAEKNTKKISKSLTEMLKRANNPKEEYLKLQNIWRYTHSTQKASNEDKF